MGPKEGRSGPAKVKNKRRKQMNKAIEDAVSEANTPEDKRSMREKVEDRISDFGRKYQDKMTEFRLTGDVQKYAMCGAVRQGDVRDNPKRGKCY
mgnify:FL=1